MKKLLKNYIRRFLKEYELKKIYTGKDSTLTNKKPTMVLMLDGRVLHGGLVDRLKGIISIKTLATQLDFDFKIYIAPNSFNIKKYLYIDSKYLIDQSSISYNLKNVKLVYLNDTMFENKNKLINNFSNKSYNQFHIYCNQDYIKLLNNNTDKNKTEKEWGSVFNELFNFNSYFSDYKKSIGSFEKTCGIHLRFTSSLGDFNDTSVRNLSDLEKSELIENCTNHVLAVLEKKQFDHYYIFSDSVTFLKHIKNVCTKEQFHNTTIMDDDIGHIDRDDDDAILQRTLLDFYLLATCNEIVQIKGPNMYNSNFSRYASYINSIPFNLDSFK